MRPKTNRSAPHTTRADVDDPVAGIVPVELDGLPPVNALFPPPTGVVGPTTTNVTVCCALVVPVIVSV